ncbi:MAG: C4-dicarboxylate TRAP transporter substrate-binding protein [Desulfovibrio sp.]|jgi:tripartite ATP-independent transporter DctP family solute receptor|nr:C4-dicarboxylate TRAP transporter substrate-binding protein [Desulfovibrio sp.]
MMKTTFFSCLLAGALLFAPAAIAAPIVLKFQHPHTAQEPYHHAYEAWAKAVKERTKGAVEIQVFHSSQIGVEEDIIEQMRLGAPVGQSTDAARMGNYVKDFSAMNLPYFIDSLEELEKLGKLDSVKKLVKRLEDECGIHAFTLFFVQGFRHMFTNKPIYKPADLKGMRIRSAPAPAWQAMVKSLGATPVTIPYVEIYSAIQAKAVDGTEIGYTGGYAASLYEVTKYVSETRHYLLMNIPIASAKWFRDLPPEYQKILDEECEKAGRKASYDTINKLEAEAKQGMISKGTKIVESKDIDINAFKAAGKAAYEEMGVLGFRDAVWKELGKK